MAGKNLRLLKKVLNGGDIYPLAAEESSEEISAEESEQLSKGNQWDGNEISAEQSEQLSKGNQWDGNDISAEQSQLPKRNLKGRNMWQPCEIWALEEGVEKYRKYGFAQLILCDKIKKDKTFGQYLTSRTAEVMARRYRDGVNKGLYRSVNPEKTNGPKTIGAAAERAREALKPPQRKEKSGDRDPRCERPLKGGDDRATAAEDLLVSFAKILAPILVKEMLPLIKDKL